MKLSDMTINEIIDCDIRGGTAAQILDVWQQALDEMMATPPNERHFACSTLIDRLVAPYQAAVAAEHDAAIAEAQRVKAAAEQAAIKLATQSGPDVVALGYALRQAVWAFTRAAGSDVALRRCGEEVSACVADDAHG